MPDNHDRYPRALVYIWASRQLVTRRRDSAIAPVFADSNVLESEKQAHQINRYGWGGVADVEHERSAGVSGSSVERAPLPALPTK